MWYDIYPTIWMFSIPETWRGAISLVELSFVSLSYTSAMGYLQDFWRNLINDISEIHSIQSNSSLCTVKICTWRDPHYSRYFHLMNQCKRTIFVRIMRLSDNLKINIDNIDDKCKMINMWFLRPIQGSIFFKLLKENIILVWYWIESSPER
jgi:hypothetical protein